MLRKAVTYQHPPDSCWLKVLYPVNARRVGIDPAFSFVIDGPHGAIEAYHCEPIDVGMLNGMLTWSLGGPPGGANLGPFGRTPTQHKGPEQGPSFFTDLSKPLNPLKAKRPETDNCPKPLMLKTVLKATRPGQPSEDGSSTEGTASNLQYIIGGYPLVKRVSHKTKA